VAVLFVIYDALIMHLLKSVKSQCIRTHSGYFWLQR